jgi:hypothetical protein
VAAWYFATQAAASAGVRIIRAAPDLSALTGVIAASSTLRLWLSSKQPRQNKKRDNFVRKSRRGTYPYKGIKGLDSGFPEPLDGFCDGTSVEPPVCDGPSVEPRVRTPDDGALASDVDVAVPPVDEVRGDRTRGRGTTDLP